MVLWISFCADACGKGMNSFLPTPAICKIVGQTWLLSFCKATHQGEGVTELKNFGRICSTWVNRSFIISSSKNTSGTTQDFTAKHIIYVGSLTNYIYKRTVGPSNIEIDGRVHGIYIYIYIYIYILKSIDPQRDWYFFKDLFIYFVLNET